MSAFSVVAIGILSVFLLVALYHGFIFLADVICHAKDAFAVHVRRIKATQVKSGCFSPRYTRSRSPSTEKPAASKVDPKLPESVDYSIFDAPTYQRRNIALSF